MHVKNSRVTVKEKKCLNLNKLASQKLQWVQTQKSPKKRLLYLSKGPRKKQASKTGKLLNNNYSAAAKHHRKNWPYPHPHWQRASGKPRLLSSRQAVTKLHNTLSRVVSEKAE